MKRNALKLHLVQFPSVPGEPLKTLMGLRELLKGFYPRSGDWVIFPEMWPSGFKTKDFAKQRVENAFCFHWLKSYAVQKGCFLSGSMLELKKNRAYNSAYVISPRGRLMARYRKIHLFPLLGEQKKFRPGSTIQSVNFPWGNLGLSICYDLRFPELFRALARRRCKVVFVPSAWPRIRIDHFQTLMRARAIENQCFMVGTNKIGSREGSVVFGGHSVVFGPWGEKLGELGMKKEILSVKIDLAEVDEIRRRYPFLKDRIL